MKKLWNWYINIIHKYPVCYVYAAWGEGLIVGLLMVFCYII